MMKFTNVLCFGVFYKIDSLNAHVYSQWAFIFRDKNMEKQEANKIIISYGGLEEAKAYMKRWFQLSKICKNTSAQSYVTGSMKQLNDAIAEYENTD